MKRDFAMFLGFVAFFAVGYSIGRLNREVEFVPIPVPMQGSQPAPLEQRNHFSI